jgi:hypothetical protein
MRLSSREQILLTVLALDGARRVRPGEQSYVTAKRLLQRKLVTIGPVSGGWYPVALTGKGREQEQLVDGIIREACDDMTLGEDSAAGSAAQLARIAKSFKGRKSGERALELDDEDTAAMARALMAMPFGQLPDGMTNPAAYAVLCEAARRRLT